MSDRQLNLTRRNFLRVVESGHVTVGTDYPYDLGHWMAAEKISQLECSDAERQAIMFSNAGKLLRL